jgi:hypothetical protein
MLYIKGGRGNEGTGKERKKLYFRIFSPSFFDVSSVMWVAF